MTPQIGLLLSAIAFVGTHFLLSHPLRGPLVRTVGDACHEWTAQTAFVPFTRGIANPGAVALGGGTLLFLIATWAHPVPAGLWRWIG